MFKSLNRVPYPMIFMDKGSRNSSNQSRDDEHNAQLKKSWDEQMNTTSVTMQSVHNRVNKIVSVDPFSPNASTRKSFWPSHKNTQLLPKIKDPLEDQNSTPKLI